MEWWNYFATLTSSALFYQNKQGLTAQRWIQNFIKVNVFIGACRYKTQIDLQEVVVRCKFPCQPFKFETTCFSWSYWTNSALLSLKDSCHKFSSEQTSFESFWNMFWIHIYFLHIMSHWPSVTKLITWWENWVLIIRNPRIAISDVLCGMNSVCFSLWKLSKNYFDRQPTVKHRIILIMKFSEAWIMASREADVENEMEILWKSSDRRVSF